MNLFTAQMNTLRIDNEPIVVHVPRSHHEVDENGNYEIVFDDGSEGNFWTDTYGRVQGHPECASHPIGFSPVGLHCAPGYRECTHLLEDPLPANLFGIDWVRRLCWQPTLYTVGNCPVIASRVGTVITLAWDCVGPLEDCDNRPTIIEERNKWVYELHPLVFDDCPDEVFDRALIGVWPD